ncbi:MAG: [protein-PII] uridylyltransferase [Hyphomonadaceae bacterium]|nr:[protein-PII] uridylyltransferase [Hyphomonadaceae bacterium]
MTVTALGDRNPDVATALARARGDAKAGLEAGRSGHDVARRLSRDVDAVLGALFAAVATETPAVGVALVAVGGYGRGELAPFSDLDLLFLTDDNAVGPDRFVEAMLYRLWDAGAKIGHASRTVEQNLKLARDDYTIRTSLLEARVVAGDERLARSLLERLRREVIERDQAGFIAAKLSERDQRHARAGASRYMVEPNIKEGKGGLRDLHTLFWLARHRYGLDESAYVSAGVFTEAERASLRSALRFLWTVRCRLHFVAGRAEERLTFDLQPELAAAMGFVAKGEHSGVERFMTRYFRVAREVGMLTRILCAKLEADHAKHAPAGIARSEPCRREPEGAIADGFLTESGRLDVETPAVLETPRNLMRLFVLADAHDLDIHPEALGAAARVASRMPRSWRLDAAAREEFLKAVASGRRPGATLRRMNDTGVLGAFLPEFGRIVAKMQFNMYHHFTVDEHTLKAIEALSEIERGRYGDQHPLATELFSKIKNRRALYLAMLLHDTGKGEGDQQIEGEKAARRACRRLGLGTMEVEVVAWLVRHHLVMSDVAQKRDLSDPHTIAEFARVVGGIERLRLLLILTVADMRAVGPNVWNAWKGQLLRDLYRLTEAALHGGRSDESAVRDLLSNQARLAKQRLVDDLGAEALSEWLDLVEDAYWLSNDAEALAWHAREVLAAQADAAVPHVAARVREAQGVTEVLVYARDRRGLFASLAAAISLSGADIAGARVYTTTDNFAFDVFTIQTSDLKAFGAEHPAALRALISRVRKAAIEDAPLPEPKLPSRRAAAFAIEPWVRIDNQASAVATVVEASGRDRSGLLAALARACADAGASIVSAHIDTYGERAADVFYLQDEAGKKLVNPDQIDALSAGLEAALRAGEPAAPATSSNKALAVGRASTAR